MKQCDTFSYQIQCTLIFSIPFYCFFFRFLFLIYHSIDFQPTKGTAWNSLPQNVGPKTSTQYARSSLTVQSKASRPSPLKTERGPIPTESISMHRAHADGTLICGTLPPCLIPVFSCHTCCTLCHLHSNYSAVPKRRPYPSQCGREVQHRQSKEICIRMRPDLSALNGIILMQISAYSLCNLGRGSRPLGGNSSSRSTVLHRL